MRPDVVVSDILTLAPALAAEVADVPRVTLIPHVYPVHGDGLPFFGFGLRAARTALGRAVWRAGGPVLEAGLRRGRRELNEERAALGLAPQERFHGGISEGLVLVATYPQLEYPRRWPAHVHVTGPMFFELPYQEVALPDGDKPLVLVAPSTSQDPDGRLVRVALEALADEPVRVVATWNREERRARGGRARQRGRGRLALLLAGNAARRPGDLPWRARDGCAGARGGRPCARVPSDR